MTFRLLIVDPNGGERELDLQGPEYILGRDPNVELPLRSPKVSRRHARIFKQGGGYFIEDLNSANGVYFEGRKIPGKKKLEPGCELEICGFRLIISGEGGGELLLVGTTVPVQGDSFTLPQGEHDVGRVDTCAICVPDNSVSRGHATIFVRGPRVIVRDHGSSNGTFVNDEKIEEAPVGPGDRIRFGRVEFKVVFETKKQMAQGLKLGLLIGVAALVLLITGIIVWQVKKAADAKAHNAAITAYEAQLSAQLEKAHGFLKREAWTEASAAFGEVLAKDPINQEARAGRDLAELNLKHKQILEAAQRDLAKKSPADALSRLAGVPADAYLAEHASVIAKQARGMIAERALDGAKKACKKNDFKECHRQAVIHLENAATQQPVALALVSEAEHGMKVRRLAFTPWAPRPETPRQGSGIELKYPDEVVREAALRYAAGDVDTALKRARTSLDRPGAAKLAALLSDLKEARGSAETARTVGDVERALAGMDRLLQLDATILPPTHPSTLRGEAKKSSGALLHKLGEAAAAGGNWREAAARWLRGLNQDPNNPDLLAAIGRLETRAVEMLKRLPAGNLRREDCTLLDEIVATTLPTSPSYAQARQRATTCR